SVRTVAEYRASLVRQLFSGALNQRLYERVYAEAPPFLSASANYGTLGEMLGTFEVNVSARNAEIPQGLDAALSEIERIFRFGITDVEFERMRESMIRNIENSESEMADIPSRSYVQAYLSSFIGGSPLVDPSALNTITKQLLPTIT